MTKFICNKIYPYCWECKDVKFTYLGGFPTFKELVQTVGIMEALSIAEFTCPYRELLKELELGSRCTNE